MKTLESPIWATEDRGDVIRKIIELVREAATIPAPSGRDPLDDDLPGG